VLRQLTCCLLTVRGNWARERFRWILFEFLTFVFVMMLFELTNRIVFYGLIA
jgi:hypothetical protein